MTAAVVADLNQLDVFHELLPALAGSLDVRDIFQQISAAASRILPHDEASLVLHLEKTDEYRLYASTGAGPKATCRDLIVALHGDDLIQPRLQDSPCYGAG